METKQLTHSAFGPFPPPADTPRKPPAKSSARTPPLELAPTKKFPVDELLEALPNAPDNKEPEYNSAGDMLPSKSGLSYTKKLENPPKLPPTMFSFGSIRSETSKAAIQSTFTKDGLRRVKKSMEQKFNEISKAHVEMLMVYNKIQALINDHQELVAEYLLYRKKFQGQKAAKTDYENTMYRLRREHHAAKRRLFEATN